MLCEYICIYIKVHLIVDIQNLYTFKISKYSSKLDIYIIKLSFYFIKNLK